jgi:hypothetical protein
LSPHGCSPDVRLLLSKLASKQKSIMGLGQPLCCCTVWVSHNVGNPQILTNFWVSTGH